MPIANSHIMLDLETMGTDPYSPVIAIGACRFEINDELIMDFFYQPIKLESCMKLGLKPSASTIEWWMDQSPEAKALFKDPTAVDLPLALDAFTEWHNSDHGSIWGNSASFDCGLLKNAYKACDKEVPWQFWQEKCYRTLKGLVPDVKLSRIGTFHNARDDAISQAIHLRDIYKRLGLK